MKSLPERLNEEIEHHGIGSSQHQQPSLEDLAEEPQIAALVSLAWHLQQAAPLQVDPEFARRLEQRVLLQIRAVQEQSQKRRLPAGLANWLQRETAGSWPRTLRLAVVSLLCLLLLGGGSLFAAAQVANPVSPLYRLKLWQQNISLTAAGSDLRRAQLRGQLAREQLQALAGLVNSPQAYRAALRDFEEKMELFAQAIHALPAGADRTRLTEELTRLEADARQMLYQLLPRLAIPERLLTTSELGRLGANIIHLSSAMITVSQHPKSVLTVSLSGSGLQPGATLLLDNQPVSAAGTLTDDAYTFLLVWQGRNRQLPRSLGLLNPDGTAVATTAVVVKYEDRGNGANSGNSNQGNGNGNARGKPTAVPTPHHSFMHLQRSVCRATLAAACLARHSP
jgi:hypothetical protein